MTDKYIVSIDLGTSKIGVAVAKVEGNDVQIVYYRETPAAGMKYSGILNVSQAKEAVEYAISLAEKSLNIKITQAVVGMPKYPVQVEKACGKRTDRGEDEEITEDSIEALKRSALENYPLEDSEKQAIYGAVAQSFSDGENFQLIEKDIIGMMSDVLEGNFKIFIGKKGELKRIDQVMERIGVTPVSKVFTAESTAKVTLTSHEMENGVALIDFGAGCTSVSIYHENIMTYYASIPFGGKNITDDIKNEAEISGKLAENIKLAFGVCMPERLQSLSEKIIQIQDEGSENKKRIPVKYLSEIITARVEEILLAILYEIEKSEIADELKCGIVVTGGVANTPNLCNFITEVSGYRARVGYPIVPFSFIGCESIGDTGAASSVGLISAALNKTGIDYVQNRETPQEEDTENEEQTGEVAEVPENDGKNRDIWGNVIEDQAKEKRKSQTRRSRIIKEKEKKDGDNEATIWTIIKDEIHDLLQNGNGKV